MGDKRALKVVCALLVAMVVSDGLAFVPVPKESAKALRITRGKPFSKGAVFVNGKYLAPPYVVERWGTGLRINKVPVTGQVIDWGEFLKTQDGVKVTKPEPDPAPVAASAPAAAASAPAPAAEEDPDESSLDDLFDDDPKPKKKKSSSGRSSGAAAVASTRTAPPARPKPSATYELSGDFVLNDASKALLTRINAARTDIDRLLRKGGFICFGDNYSQVTGDSRTLMRLIEKLPELQQHSSDAREFYSGMRAAHLDYLHEALCADLYANRVDYPQLKQRRTELKKERELERVLDGLSQPLF